MSMLSVMQGKRISLQMDASSSTLREIVPSVLTQIEALGVRQIMVLPSVSSTAAETFRFIRDATAHGMDVVWTLPKISVPWARLCHLLPPVPDGAKPDIDLWRRSHRYALFFFRQGRSFVTLKDLRRRGPAAVTVIDDTRHLDMFRRCLSGCDVELVRRIDQGAYRTLQAAGIIEEFDGVALTMPYRLRRWPVNYIAF